MLTEYRVYYYLSEKGENPVKEFIDSLEANQQVKILRIFQYIEEYGLESVISHIKKLSDTPFWKIRILGKNNIRIIYIIPTKNSILVLHGFTKKTQKTPTKEISICFTRFNNWQRNH